MHQRIPVTHFTEKSAKWTFGMRHWKHFWTNLDWVPGLWQKLESRKISSGPAEIFLSVFSQSSWKPLATVSTLAVSDLDWHKRAIRHGSFNNKCDARHQICSSSLLYNLVQHLLRFSMWGTCCFLALADKAAQSELQTGKKHSAASVLSFWKHVCFILL